MLSLRSSYSVGVRWPRAGQDVTSPRGSPHPSGTPSPSEGPKTDFPRKSDHPRQGAGWRLRMDAATSSATAWIDGSVMWLVSSVKTNPGSTTITRPHCARDVSRWVRRAPAARRAPALEGARAVACRMPDTTSRRVVSSPRKYPRPGNHTDRDTGDPPGHRDLGHRTVQPATLPGERRLHHHEHVGRCRPTCGPATPRAGPPCSCDRCVAPPAPGECAPVGTLQDADRVQVVASTAVSMTSVTAFGRVMSER
jgi:hypothetical protein